MLQICKQELWPSTHEVRTHTHTHAHTHTHTHTHIVNCATLEALNRLNLSTHTPHPVSVFSWCILCTVCAGYFDRVQVPPITPIAEPVTPLEEPPSYPGHTMAPTMTMDPWQRGGEGTSGGIIHTAALEGVKSGEMKRLAIQYGVDSRDQGGRTPLMYAVLGNQPKVCEQLIKLRANIDIKDLSGQTPLLWATFLARAELVRVLLK